VGTFLSINPKRDGLGGRSSSASFDSGLVLLADALLPCGGGLVRLGDIRARLGFRHVTNKDEPSSYHRVPVPDSDGSASLQTASVADGDGSSTLVGAFVPLADRGARYRCQHDWPWRCVLQVLPSGFITYYLRRDFTRITLNGNTVREG
jgi:hypothetical protein